MDSLPDQPTPDATTQPEQPVDQPTPGQPTEQATPTTIGVISMGTEPAPAEPETPVAPEVPTEPAPPASDPAPMPDPVVASAPPTPDPSAVAVLAQGVAGNAAFTPYTEDDHARAALLDQSTQQLSGLPAPDGFVYAEYTGPADCVGLPDYGTLQPGDVVLLTTEEACGTTVVTRGSNGLEQTTIFPPLDNYRPLSTSHPPAGRRVYITPGHMPAFAR